jgi:hypothetical protein
MWGNGYIPTVLMGDVTTAWLLIIGLFSSAIVPRLMFPRRRRDGAR